MKPYDLSTVFRKEVPVTDLLDTLCDTLEVDFAAYAGINTIDNSMHGFVNYPDAWKDHYSEQGFHLIDPTLQSAQHSMAPVDWTRLEHGRDFQSVFNAAADFGIPSVGITVPVRGPFGDRGMLSVTRDCSAAQWEKMKPFILTELQTYAAHIHDSVMQRGLAMKALRTPSLSQRELEILQWTAAGKTQSDISDILSISSRTVEVHLRSAREKLSALTTAQAVARAVGLGMIYPS